MKNTKQFIWLVLIVAVVIIIITLSFILWAYFSNSSFVDQKSKDSLITESAKTLLQLAGVAVLGGYVKLLYDRITEQRREAEKEEEQRQANQAAANEMRKGLLNELIDARSVVEATRIKYLVDELLNPVEQYRTAILAIVEARLQLYHIWHAIETSRRLFAGNSNGLTSNIKAMKEYLDELIDEYEKRIGELRNLSPDKVVGELRKYKVFGDFISKHKDSEYEKRFLNDAYRPAVSVIRNEVLGGG